MFLLRHIHLHPFSTTIVQGKKGKTFRDRAVHNGETGTVCFNIYTDDGIAESAGAPYRIVLNKLDLRNSLMPESLIDRGLRGVRGEQFIFGGALTYGPVLPINIGSLESPTSSLLGTLSYAGPEPATVQVVSSVTFPSIPAEKQTRYGELDPTAAKTMVSDCN